MSCCNCCCEKKEICCVKKEVCCVKKEICCCGPVMNDCLAKEIECIWKQSFCDAAILPVIGYPSCACGVMTLTHSLGKCFQKLSINGLKTKSIIANNAFYSAEVSDCKWLNLYQISIPDVPGECGCKSSTEVYTEALVKLGISIVNVGSNWKGTCPHIVTVNSIAIGMEPKEFTKKQIAAVKAVLNYITPKQCC